MTVITTAQLLRRHAMPFIGTLSILTALLLANVAARQLPRLAAQGVPPLGLLEALLLAVPSTTALTVPMAVFLAVAWVFTRLGKEGVLAFAQRESHGVRHLVVPVLSAAAVIAALTFVSNDQILPRANARFAAILSGGSIEKTDRSMTIGELRAAAQAAASAARPEAALRAVEYEVEIQKKFALAAASLVLALAAVSISFRFPRAGLAHVVGGSVLVFTGYYIALVVGEALADERLIPPSVAMWMANTFLCAIALLLVWRPGVAKARPAAAA